jgi:hypothetical protein
MARNFDKHGVVYMLHQSQMHTWERSAEADDGADGVNKTDPKRIFNPAFGGRVQYSQDACNLSPAKPLADFFAGPLDHPVGHDFAYGVQDDLLQLTRSFFRIWPWSVDTID